jgi:xanthine/uracil permease
VALTAIGRVASAIVLLAVATMVVMVAVRPDLGTHSGPVHVLDWVGLVLYLAVPVTWISAILHWAIHFPRTGPKTLWGLVVVLGFVPGAIVYWVWGFKHALREPADGGRAD